MLTVHLSRCPPELPPEPSPGLLSDHLLAVHGGPYADNFSEFHRCSQSSSAVAAWMRTDEVPDLIVDRHMTQLPGAQAAGALFDDHTCRVGLRTQELRRNGHHGMLVTMTTDVADAPVELFPSVLLGWSYWWRQRVMALRDRRVASEELPPPPERLDLVEAGRSYGVRLKGWERTKWPSPPPRPRIGWMDVDET